MKGPHASSWVHSVAAVLARLAWPFARLWARRGYFTPRRGGFGLLSPDGQARIAIVACHWIGDTVWASQVVPALRARFPKAELFVFSKPHCMDLWEGLIEPDHRISAAEVISDRRRESVAWRAIARLAARHRPSGFDVVIDLTGNRYSALFTFLLRPGYSIGFDGNECGWLYSSNVRDAERIGRHLMERPFRVIEPLIGSFCPPELPAPPQTTVSPATLCAELGLPGDYAVLAPGAGWPAKQWPAERFVLAREAFNAARLAVVIAGSAAETSLCQAVAGPANCVAAGLPLSNIIALLKAARGFVGNDSGLGHLAAALGVPTAVIFTGATDPALCRPLGPAHTVKVFLGDPPVPEVVAHVLGVARASCP